MRGCERRGAGWDRSEAGVNGICVFKTSRALAGVMWLRAAPARSSQRKPDVMAMYMFGQARGALREAMRSGAEDAAAIEARFEGREVYAAGRAAKRNLLVGYEQAAAFEDTEPHLV